MQLFKSTYSFLHSTLFVDETFKDKNRNVISKIHWQSAAQLKKAEPSQETWKEFSQTRNRIPQIPSIS